MRSIPSIRQAAVTLTELLVVLVIISILSTIALPVYINQSERARIASARQEVFELAQAEETCGIEHGLYVPLQVLDDLPGLQNNSSIDDSILRETNVNAIDFNIPFNGVPSDASLPFLGTSDPRVIHLRNDWKGPFINFQRFNDATLTNPYDLNQDDYPLDPWGNTYRFYSPWGLIDGDVTQSSDGTYPTNSFPGNVSGTTDSGRFDRWAIASWGPDGVRDTNTAANVHAQDDIVYVFGFTRAETAW